MAKNPKGANSEGLGPPPSPGKTKQENWVTAGRIETANQGFAGNITTEAPFNQYYGPGKEPGSQPARVTAAGRGAKSFPFFTKGFNSTGKGKGKE